MMMMMPLGEKETGTRKALGAALPVGPNGWRGETGVRELMCVVYACIECSLA